MEVLKDTQRRGLVENTMMLTFIETSDTVGTLKMRPIFLRKAVHEDRS